MDKTATTTQLHRRIGLPTATFVVVGCAIGSGIFKKPALMAQQLGSPKLLILVWVVAGLLTLFGSLSNAEIAAMFPETGGQFFFFKKIYGEFISYLYGWSIFSVIQTGSIAGIAYIFAESLGHIVTLPHFSVTVEQRWVLHIPFIGNIFMLADIGTKLTAIALITLLTSINYAGLVLGSAVQNAITGLKLVAMAAIVSLIFFGQGSFSHFNENLASAPTTFGALLPAFVAALSGAFWAYDGWNNVTFIAGEIENPQRNLPRSLFFGTWIVILTYVLINVAYIYVLPMSSMASSHLVAAEMAQKVLGQGGEKAILLAILLSTFGACNGAVMTSPRVYFAMARERMFFSPIGRVHPKFETPANSLILQLFWASALVLSGTFDTLTNMLIFVTWIFYALAAAGVFILRKKMPERHRPYKVWGYPWVPGTFVLMALGYVIVTLVSDVQAYNAGKVPIINSVFGLFLVFVGCPLYFYFLHRKNSGLAAHG